MWPAMNFFIKKKKGAGLKNPMTIILFKIWPSNRFSRAKSYNFYFCKNYFTWSHSANGLFQRTWVLKQASKIKFF